MDLDCHRGETSAFLGNFRAALASHCGGHKAHLADLLESLPQVEALADHPWSVSMERDLADALAASKAGSAVLEDASGSACRSRRSPQPSQTLARAASVARPGYGSRSLRRRLTSRFGCSGLES